jgi:flagellar hook-associated protein FlgK
MSIAISSGSSAAATGLSGMRAAQLRLDAGAHNLANAQTPGFQRQQVVQTAQPGAGGVGARVGQEPASLAQGADGFNRLAEDIVEQRVSLYSFEANLRTVQTQDAMLGTLLDVRV